MISKLGPVALILALAAGCATGDEPESPGSPITVVATKNVSYVMPLDDAKMNGGYLLRVNLKIPSGVITSVDYACEGADECAHIRECPAGDRCGPDHAERLTVHGKEATWWAWTDDGMTKDAVLRFKIHFTGADPATPPC